MNLPFADRAAAGRLLAQRLADEDLPRPWVVLALARGGVLVGAEVARQLRIPLDLVLVRKIGAPWQPELAVAAVADGAAPVVVVDEDTRVATGADPAYLEREAATARQEIERQRKAYLGGRAAQALAGATAIVVDDGIATGTTVRAALQAVRDRHPARVVLAVPVAAHQVLLSLRPRCDRIVCLAEPQPFRAVGAHYRDFRHVTDGEVIAALDAADTWREAPT